jgi:serine/threonine protein kinase
MKRECLKKLALEIRRLHQSGFVHGDLIPTNIWVQAEGSRIDFFLIDHDRTRRYPAWLPQSLWKRNLVQLNRFALPGISLHDRMRFLHSYPGVARWRKREARLIAWLEEKTRLRRFECERIKAKVSFRELMRWNGPFSRSL